MSKYPRMHSAEHLLNQAMVRRFSCDRCFSAHINSKKSKCDYHFDHALTDSEVNEIQNTVNQTIASNLPVTEAQMPKAEALKAFDLERVPESDTLETFRVVCVGDYDACPCIGPHVANTAQIGTFKITTTSFENGTLRIRFKLAQSA